MKLKTLLISGLLMFSFTNKAFADISPNEYKDVLSRSFDNLNNSLPKDSSAYSLIRYGFKDGYLNKEIEYLESLNAGLYKVHDKLTSLKIEGSIYNHKNDILIRDIENVIVMIDNNIKIKLDIYNSNKGLVHKAVSIITVCDPDTKDVNAAIENLNKTYKEIYSLKDIY